MIIDEKGLGENVNAYQRAVVEFESSSLRPENDSPENLLDRLVNIQQHLDERFTSRAGGIAWFTYSVKGRFSVIKSNLTKNDPDYKRTDLDLVAEQQSITSSLLNTFEDSRSRMLDAYNFLENARINSAEVLENATQRYLCINDELIGAEETQKQLLDEAEFTTAQSTRYAKVLTQIGDVKLTRQRLVNEYEVCASTIQSTKTNLEELLEHQLIIQESEQIIHGASTSLTNIALQQSIAYAVISAFSQGQESMNVAFKVVKTLTSNIRVTHNTIQGAYKSLDSLATRVKRENPGADPCMGLYQKMRGSKKHASQSSQDYVRKLYEVPIVTTAQKTAGM